MQRPGAGNAVWRLVNDDVVQGKWWITELHFFNDLICEKRVHGKPLASVHVRPSKDLHMSALSTEIRGLLLESSRSRT